MESSNALELLLVYFSSLKIFLHKFRAIDIHVVVDKFSVSIGFKSKTGMRENVPKLIYATHRDQFVYIPSNNGNALKLNLDFKFQLKMCNFKFKLPISDMQT